MSQMQIYKARSEWSSCNDLLRMVYVLKKMATKEGWKIAVRSMIEGEDTFDCSELVFGSTLDFDEIHSKMVEASKTEEAMDTHRVYQTMAPIDMYTGDYYHIPGDIEYGIDV